MPKQWQQKEKCSCLDTNKRQQQQWWQQSNDWIITITKEQRIHRILHKAAHSEWLAKNKSNEQFFVCIVVNIPFLEPNNNHNTTVSTQNSNNEAAEEEEG